MTDSISRCVEIIGQALLHSTWQVAAIGALAWAALGLLRTASANLRYLVACGALVLTLVAPLLQIGVALFAGPVAMASALPSSMPPMPAEAKLILADVLHSNTESLLPWLVAIWAIGAAVMSLRVTIGLTWVHRLRRRASPLTAADWSGTMARLVRELGLARRVELLTADLGGGPISAGFLRPFILVPTAMLARVPTDVIEALIAHELAHIKRHDYLVNLVQSLVETLLFYHPVVWWLSRRIRVEREYVADRIATRSSIAPQRLAHALAALDTYAHAERQLIQAAEGGQLMSRIEQLLKPRAIPVGGKLGFAAIGAAALIVAVLAHAQGVQPVSTAADPTATSAPVAPLAPLAPLAPAAPPTPATPLTPLTPATPATPMTPATPSSGSPPASDDTYALVQGKGRDGFSMAGSLEDLDAIRAAQRQLDGKFVWFRRGSSAYIIRDPAIVNRVELEFADSRKHDAELENLSAEMDRHSDKVNALAARLEEIVGDMSGRDVRQASEAIEARAEKQQKLSEEYDAISKRVAEVDERERDALVARLNAIEVERVTLDYELRQLETELVNKTSLPDSAQAEAASLEKQIHEASKPMEPLGKKIEAVATEQRKKFEASDRRIRQLLAEAQSKGLVQPAPARM